MIDFVDLEHTMYEKSPNLAKEVIGTAKKQGVQVLVSKHDFKETPDLQTLEKWIAQMDQAGGDILKLAVMANSKNDAIRMMEVAVAQKQKKPDCPIIFIAMGAYGMITRIMAEFMDSFLIFANAGELTAPGQLPLEKARVLVDLIHEIKGFEN
jgi:3-dehydroquinate dehydratase-1